MHKLPSIDFERLSRERSLPSKRERQGWLQINCPFCQDESFHLGYKLNGGYFNCYRCGGLGLIRVLRKLFPAENLKRLIDSYSSSVPIFRPPTPKKKRLIVDVELPTNYPLKKAHQAYLLKRGFAPKRLEEDWGLRSTSHYGVYAFRILIPVTYRGKVVSFQTRDITDKAEVPYLAADAAIEARSIKHCLYGYDEARAFNRDFVVVFEGVPSVWRWGKGAVATFGVGYTPEQVLLLSQWKTIVVWYDNDEAGLKNGKKLADELSVLGCTVHLCFCSPKQGKAPDEWPQKRADRMKHKLMISLG